MNIISIQDIRTIRELEKELRYNTEIKTEVFRIYSKIKVESYFEFNNINEEKLNELINENENIINEINSITKLNIESIKSLFPIFGDLEFPSKKCFEWDEDLKSIYHIYKASWC
jgi:hypothetical protein